MAKKKKRVLLKLSGEALLGEREYGIDPKMTNQLNGICPNCGKPITIGVLHRVHDLAAHPTGYKPKHAGQVVYSVPLQEIIADALEKGKQSKSLFRISIRSETEIISSEKQDKCGSIA